MTLARFSSVWASQLCRWYCNLPSGMRNKRLWSAHFLAPLPCISLLTSFLKTGFSWHLFIKMATSNVIAKGTFIPPPLAGYSLKSPLTPSSFSKWPVALVLNLLLCPCPLISPKSPLGSTICLFSRQPPCIHGWIYHTCAQSHLLCQLQTHPFNGPLDISTQMSHSPSNSICLPNVPVICSRNPASPQEIVLLQCHPPPPSSVP